ncbi:MAG: ADP compounds hydrolase NudE [Gammaproteobacteria bacterium]|jgi:ADP-ribose diphosphatase|nr:ADP compounds hydrolase NudE [Gammaproteobacteria bacterium]MBT4608018.1 ADP compounds hydrolase NudE [Thiotrichales bacterium]MBT3471936.1 ADP compounds hydrolase NudE [Gammaproteobacteria bacterium]MBT3966391.1 ADP compounds hydrolase NudE [Gammaproteobacteria bacterium]MBT4080401.1 ADP compounds hydrolase NudE [Gammaproteobacteria bacterium]
MERVNPERKPPQVLKTEVCAQSRLFTVESIDLRFSNGVEAQWERLKGSSRGAVLIVPMLDEDTVLLIREYAAGVERYELALPKGKIDPGESTLDAANREMMEEVGYGAKRLTHLDSVTIAPGYLSHTTHIVLGEELYEQRLEGDEPEEVEVIPWKLSELSSLLAHPEMTEARSIAALFMVRERQQQ